MIKRYYDYIKENLKVNKDIKVKDYFKGYKTRVFDENCIEIDNIMVDIAEFNKIKNIFSEYYVFYNEGMKQIWIKDKPDAIILSDYFDGEYLYHDSRKEHRDSILKNGLRTNSTISYGEETPMCYENLLFFYDIDTFESYDPRDDKDIWAINVKKYKLQWYDNPNKHFDEEEGVYCLQQGVPSEYLELKSHK